MAAVLTFSCNNEWCLEHNLMSCMVLKAHMQRNWHSHILAALERHSSQCKQQFAWEGATEWHVVPSTSEVSKVTLAAFRLPAGRLRPILSSFSLRERPPFFDLALQMETKTYIWAKVVQQKTIPSCLPVNRGSARDYRWVIAAPNEACTFIGTDTTDRPLW